MKRYPLTIILSFVILFFSCTTQHPSRKPVVVTSISVYADIVHAIAGSTCTVQSLVTGNENPHTFDLTGDKAKLVHDADIIVFNGLGLEGWGGQVIQGLDRKKTHFISVADSLAGSPLLVHGDNPHIWMDPRIGVLIVQTLVKPLQHLVPDSAAAFQSRADQYISDLRDLYRDINIKLEPIHGKKVIAQTPGLDYFFTAVQMHRTAVIVDNPGTEPSARHMTELIDSLNTGNMYAIARLPQFSEKLPDTLEKETGVPVTLMSPLINGAPYVDTYIDLLWFNADQIMMVFSPES